MHLHNMHVWIQWGWWFQIIRWRPRVTCTEKTPTCHTMTIGGRVWTGKNTWKRPCPNNALIDSNGSLRSAQPSTPQANKWGPTWVLHNDMWGFTSSGFDPSSIAPILVQGAIPETNLISIALAEAPNVADLSWGPWAPGRSLKHGVEWVRAADICLNYLYSVFCGFSGGVLKAWTIPKVKMIQQLLSLAASPSFKNFRLSPSAKGISCAPRHESSNMDPKLLRGEHPPWCSDNTCLAINEFNVKATRWSYNIKISQNIHSTQQKSSEPILFRIYVVVGF